MSVVVSSAFLMDVHKITESDDRWNERLEEVKEIQNERSAYNFNECENVKRMLIFFRKCIQCFRE